MTKVISYFLLFVSFVSCKQDSKYQGFSVSDSGLNYKIHTLGDSVNLLKNDDFVAISYSRYTHSGEVIESGKMKFNLQYQDSDTSKLMQLLGLISVGDSASYIESSTTQDQLFSCKLLLKVPNNVTTVLQGNSQFEKQISQGEIIDVLKLLSSYKTDSIQYVGGMFIIHQIIGSGRLPDTGDEVKFHMEGKNIQGKLLESTRKADTPFSYVLGDQDQVIEGLDYGIRRMKKGGGATFIIPSQLAYGKSGSSTGIIGPYNTLVYFIELLDVKH